MDIVDLYGQAQESNLIHIKQTHCPTQSGYGRAYEHRNLCRAVNTITTSYTNPAGQLQAIGSDYLFKP